LRPLQLACATTDALTPAQGGFFVRSSRHELRSLTRDRSPMFVAHHFDHHSTTNHPTSPSSDPFPCSLSPTGSVLDGLGFAHSQQSRQLAWPNRVHLRCGLGVSHSVAPDHASRHRPYSVLLVLSRFNNAGLSPALISAPWRTGTGVLARHWSLDICRASNAP